MTDISAYYDQSLPPSLWETPPGDEPAETIAVTDDDETSTPKPTTTRRRRT